MRNVISIDVINSCSCNAIAITDTKTNEIIIEVITGDANSPRLELIRHGDTYKSVTLNANASNLVELKESEWALSDSIQFRYVDQERTGELFTMYFPATINDIYVNMTSDTVFTVVSKSSSGGGGGTGGNVNVVDNLTSMSTTDALSANQGRVLKESLNVTNNVVSNLSGEVSDNSSDISTLQSKVSGNSSSISVLSAYVNEVSIQVGTTASDVKNLKESNQNIVNKLANHTTDIGDLFELTDELDKRIDSNDSDISELQSKVGEGLSVEVGTVTTAEAGTEASVTNTGTDTHAVLDFIIPKGDAGKNGVSVSSVAQTTTSTADGGTNVVTVTLSDDTKSTFNVKNGSKGSTGNGIKSTAVTYQASTSGTTVPTGTWSTTIPTVSAGGYLWTRVEFNYTDGTTTTAYGVAKHGANGGGGGTGGSDVSFSQALTSGTKIGTLTIDGTAIDLYAPTYGDDVIGENLLAYPYFNTTHADNVITFTDNGDGTIDVSEGTATGVCYFLFRSYGSTEKTPLVLSKGTYTISGATTEIYIEVYSVVNNAMGTLLARDKGKGYTFTLTEDTQIVCRIMIAKDTSVTASSIKPMLEVGSTAHLYQLYNLSRQKLRADIDAIGTGGSDVTVTPALTSGAKVATINVDGESTDLYAPTYGVATTSANGLMSSADKSKLDNALSKSDVVDNLTSTSTTAPLSAKQGKVINDKVNNLKEHAYSLLIDKQVTTTEQTFTTYSSRKISDYDFILIRMGLGSLEVRTTLFLPTATFRATNRQFYLDCHAGNGSVYNQILVTYVSDAQIKAKCTVAPSATIYLNIEGFKIIDKSTL